MLLTGVLALASAYTFAQSWPAMQTENLEGTTVQLPSDIQGKKTLIGLAFSQKAQDQFNSWLEPVYKQFIDKNGFGAMVYDAHVYMTLMFNGAKSVALNKAKKQIKAATDRDYFPYILLYQGSYQDLKSALQVSNKNDFQLYVLDENGKILHHTSGRYTESKFDEMSSYAEE